MTATYEYVEEFNSDESSEDEELREPPPKRRRTTRTWVNIRTYESKEEAEQFVTDEQVWTKSRILKLKNALTTSVIIGYRQTITGTRE